MWIIEAFPKVCLIIAGTCLIGMMIGYPAAHWIGGKVAAFLSFLPQERFAKPEPALGIPAAKAMRGDLQGAVESYEQLLATHPREKEIHFRLIELLLGPMHAEERGEQALQRGLANLTEAADRAALLTIAREIREGSYHPYGFLDHGPAPKPPGTTVFAPHPPRLVKAIPRA